MPRERYLGPGPWQIARPDVLPGARPSYRATPDADPRHLYHNIVVGIDPARALNNGQPSALATWIDSLALHPGERVLHVGCGVGYYTAILAEMVGPTGHVLAVETDPDLAARAARNLEHLGQVEVVHADGAAHDPGPFDAGLVNAGATRLERLWLDRIEPNGRLLVPLTISLEPDGLGTGFMLRIERTPEGYAARFVSGVAIYPCLGARDPESNARLREALAKGAWRTVRALRRDRHERGDACLLHAEDYCLSSGIEGPSAR